MGSIGTRLRLERERLGFNQTDFAAFAEQSKKSQIRYEADERSPDGLYLAAIADRGADIFYILTGRRMSEVDALIETRTDTGSEVIPVEVKFSARREDPTDPPQDFVPIPLYAVRLAAGAGAENQAEAVIEHLAFRADWLRRIGVAPAAARLARVQGDSMLPTLQPDDLVLIDTAQRNVLARSRSSADTRPSPIFALRHDGGAVVKRLERVSDDQLILLSDNPAHPPQLWSGADLEATEIIGKVVWWGHTVRE